MLPKWIERLIDEALLLVATHAGLRHVHRRVWRVLPKIAIGGAVIAVAGAVAATVAAGLGAAGLAGGAVAYDNARRGVTRWPQPELVRPRPWLDPVRATLSCKTRSPCPPAANSVWQVGRSPAERQAAVLVTHVAHCVVVLAAGGLPDRVSNGSIVLLSAAQPCNDVPLGRTLDELSAIACSRSADGTPGCAKSSSAPRSQTPGRRSRSWR